MPGRGRRLRKTEIGLGIVAGSLGIVLGLLSFFEVLPYRVDTFIPHNADTTLLVSILMVGANAIGIFGALTVHKHHVLGSAVMGFVTLAVLIIGFPWQSISAVAYIMSIVMALVPVKAIQ